MTTTLPSPIRRPGTDVIQVIQENEVRVVRPVLQEVIVGPCFKVLEVTDTDGSLNEDARFSLPAIYQGLDTEGVASTASHTATADDEVTITLPGVAPLVVTFVEGTSYTPATAAAFIQEAANTAGTPITADAVALSDTNVSLRIRTQSVGSGQSLTVSWDASATMQATFAIPGEWVATGYTKYDGTRLFVTKDMFPDPWSLGDDLDVIESTVRGFLTTASTIKKELRRTTGLDRTVMSRLAVDDDGDGDMASPLLRFAADSAATAVRPLDIIGQNALKTLTDAEYGTLELTASPNKIIRTIGSWIEDGYAVAGYNITLAGATTPGNNTTFTVVSATETDLTIVETPTAEGPGATYTVTGSTMPARDALLTAFAAAATVAELDSVAFATLAAGPGAGVSFDLSIDGWPKQRITVNDTAPGAWTRAQVAAEINRFFPGSATDTGALVKIESTGYGREGVIRIDAVKNNLATLTDTEYGTLEFTAGPNKLIRTTGSWITDGYNVAGAKVVVTGAAEDANNRVFTVVSATATDLTVTETPTAEVASSTETVEGYIGTDMLFGGTVLDFPKIYRGTAQPPKVGDEVWTGSTKIGTITQLVTTDATGLVDQVVRLDVELPSTYFSTTPWAEGQKTWYILSKELDDEQFLSGSGDEVTPEMTVTDYIIQFKQDNLRGSMQEPMYKPMTPTDVNAYAAAYYKGLRLDVTASATTRDPVPIQISAGDFTGLDTQFDPLDSQNPLGLAGYFALLNTTQTPVWLFGVDEVTEDYPEGTPEAYARAFSAIKAIRCYGIVPLSQDLDVSLALHAHITYMSATKRRGERYGFTTFAVPERDEPEVVGSGTEGNATDPGGASPWQFQTGLADLGDLFLAADISTFSGWGPTPSGDGTEVYLQIEGDANHYMVTGYAGATITCRKRTASEDDFYADALWTDAIVDKSFGIYVRGAELLDTAGNPDRTAISTAIGKRCATFADRRMIVGAPGEVEATVSGLATRLPTYYLAAAQVSQRCSLHPSKPLTKSPVQGFTKVFKSNGYFSEDDMDQAAGFGLWWWINDEVTGTVVTRHQLTTDPTSVKTREDSIRTAVDFGTYALRDAIAPIIGTMNITTQTLDQLSMVINGVLSFLISTKVWLSAEVVRMVQGPFEATAEDLAEGLEPGGEDEVLVEIDVTVGSPLNRVRVRLLV